MTHSFVISYYHLIFCTKNRLPWIPPEIEPNLYHFLFSLALNKNSCILKINGTMNHIHILVKLYPCESISSFVKFLKGTSSMWMKQQGITNFQWQEGYAAIGCCASHLKTLENYIENQKEHHKKITLEDEMLEIENIYNSLKMKIENK